jgi:ATP-binding protein involved in chromosome partitioning
VDEESVRVALLGATVDGAPILTAEDVAGVVVEGAWAGVTLAKEYAKSRITSVHRQVTAALPLESTLELRWGREVYRGGGGFGSGKHVIAVLGGKGGVGKSTVSVNLALTLTAMGLSVGIVDADVNAPDLPHLLGVRVTRPPGGFGWQMVSEKLKPPSQRPRPEERFGMELMSVGFVVPERYAPMVTTRMLVSSLLRYLVFEVQWNAQVLLIDAPPGTGEELQVMAKELPLSGALFVTTPQDLAQMDAERTLSLLTEENVPVIGVVHNMASLTCPHCAQEIDMYAESARLRGAGVSVIGRVAFDVELSKAADRGRPLVLGNPTGPIAFEFAHIGAAVRRWLLEREQGGKES